MNRLNDNLAEELTNTSQIEQNRRDDNLTKVVDTIKKDANENPKGYLENSIVPEGGE